MASKDWVFRGICMIPPAHQSELLQKLAAVAGPPIAYNGYEEKLRRKPDSNAGNMNFAVNIVEFLLRYESSDKVDVVYIGAPMEGGTTALISIGSPRMREFFIRSGFKPVSDHSESGWKYQTRDGVICKVYRSYDALFDSELVVHSDRANWTVKRPIPTPYDQLICELSIQCGIDEIQARKIALDKLFKDFIQPFSEGGLVPVAI